MSLTNAAAMTQTAKDIIAANSSSYDVESDPNGIVAGMENLIDKVMQHIQSNGEINGNMPVGQFSQGASPTVIIAPADVPITGGSIT